MRVTLLIVLLIAVLTPAVSAAVEFKREFAPEEGLVAPPERPLRDEVCLNGLWEFQPMKVSQGEALPAPSDDAWGKVKIRIPSPWNVNSFSRSDGGDFQCFPSYPESWEHADAGWLRRQFRVPSEWMGRRIILQFEAVAGDCEVRVNGKTVVLDHFDSFMPFSADITDLVRPDEDNELLVGVRKSSLFDVQGPLGHLTYPTGSFWGEHIAGIWQDVFLLALPDVHAANVFVEPLVVQGNLVVELRIRNDSGESAEVEVGGKVYPWISEAGKTDLLAPEPRWRLGERPVLDLPQKQVELQPGEEKSVRLSESVGEKLAYWTPESPKLYGLVAEIRSGGKSLDRRYVRFGWRQFGINGSSVTLNGKPYQFRGDAWHFTGVPQMTRRYAWAWFRMLKDANANAVRLHAQPYPTFYLDVADEMGIAVLDESAIWASHCAFNYDCPDTWKRFESHVHDLVLRDRNHPSVLGWSIANEINAALGVKRAPKKTVDQIDDRFAAIAEQVRRLDPTRPWVSSDGDEDMNGRLPVIVAHYGNNDYYGKLAERGKPWGVGEATCAYYGTPKDVSPFSGDLAYESFKGRMDGVAIEAYDLLSGFQRKSASYCSIFNLAWYGLKPLPLGLRDTTRPPTLNDGIRFGSYVEGKPGMQPERLGPYCTTFNPGYDPSLPLYEPWPLFDAVKAAYYPDGPRPNPIVLPQQADHIPPTPAANMSDVAVVGKPGDPLLFSLNAAGVPVRQAKETDEGPGLLVIDGTSLTAEAVSDVRKLVDGCTSAGGTALIWGVTDRTLDAVNGLLPAKLQLTDRDAVSLRKASDDPIVSGMSAADLYFADWPMGSVVLQHGLAGPFVDGGRVILEACNTDWRRWSRRPENVKTASVLRSELETKPGGAALVDAAMSKGRLLVCNLQPMVYTPQHVKLIRELMSGLGVKLSEPQPMEGGVFDVGGCLKEALVIGGFQAESYESAIDTDFLKTEESVDPRPGDRVGRVAWQERKVDERQLFDFRKMGLPNQESNSAAYISFWLYSPRPMDQLLAQPDVPKLNLLAGSDDGAKIWLNGKLMLEERGVHPIDSEMHVVRSLPLKQGWNHFLVKVAQSAGEWAFTARLQCSDPRYLSELKSSIAPQGKEKE